MRNNTAAKWWPFEDIINLSVTFRQYVSMTQLTSSFRDIQKTEAIRKEYLKCRSPFILCLKGDITSMIYKWYDLWNRNIQQTINRIIHIYLAYLLQHSLGSNMNALGKIAFLAYGQYLPNSRDKKRVVDRDITIW